MGNAVKTVRSRTEWSPARVVWLAQIVVQDPINPGDVHLAKTVWCTDGEALFFLQRRLPNTSIPARYSSSARLYGILVPAAVHTELAGGEVVQTYRPDRAAARYASVDDKGRLVWSATQLAPRR